MIYLDEIPALDRIRISGLLAAKLEALAGGLAPLARVKVAQQVAEYLEQLGVNLSAPAKPLAGFSLSDRTGAIESIQAYLESGLSDIPAAFRAFEAQTVSDLAATADLPAASRRANNIALEGMANLEAAQIAACDEAVSRGVKIDLNPSVVLEKIGQAETILRQRPSSSPGYAEAVAKVHEVNRGYESADLEYVKAIRAAREAIRAGTGDESVIAGLIDQRAALRTSYEAEFNREKAKITTLEVAFNEEKSKRAMDLIREEGEAVLAAILKSSPITEEQATEWASRQIIDKTALSKLARLGYKKADVYRDMAEFYRICGGKSSAIRISAGGRRAHTTGVETRLGEKIICLGTRFDKGTLFHELAHHLENDPIAKAASNGFLLKRRESPVPHSLRSLTGNKGYRADEVAYKDSFINPYTGKIYRDGVTEVFSMGVEYLANPKDAAMFAAKDPQMFALITGYLTNTITPGMHAKLNMHAGAIDTLQTMRETEAEQYSNAISALADRVDLVADTWWQDLQESAPHSARWLASYAFTTGKPPEYLGSYEDFRVFQGVFKNKNTGRKSKGYLVVRASSVDAGVPEYVEVHGELDTVKAFIAVAEHRDERLSRVWYSTLYEKGRDNKKNLIAAAERLEASAQ